MATLFQFTKDSLDCETVLHGKVNIAVTNICDNEVLWNKSWFSILYLIFKKNIRSNLNSWIIKLVMEAYIIYSKLYNFIKPALRNRLQKSHARKYYAYNNLNKIWISKHHLWFSSVYRLHVILFYIPFFCDILTL